MTCIALVMYAMFMLVIGYAIARLLSTPSKKSLKDTTEESPAINNNTTGNNTDHDKEHTLTVDYDSIIKKKDAKIIKLQECIIKKDADIQRYLNEIKCHADCVKKHEEDTSSWNQKLADKDAEIEDPQVKLDDAQEQIAEWKAKEENQQKPTKPFLADAEVGDRVTLVNGNTAIITDIDWESKRMRRAFTHPILCDNWLNYNHEGHTEISSKYNYNAMDIIALHKKTKHVSVKPEHEAAIPEPNSVKPLLADAKVGDICKHRNGKWSQIVDTAGSHIPGQPIVTSLKDTEDTCHSFNLSGIWIYDNKVGCYDIIRVEPLAEEGTWDRAVQEMKLGRKMYHPEIHVNGKLWSEYDAKEDSIVTMGESGYVSTYRFINSKLPVVETGWKPYTAEPEPEPEPEPEKPLLADAEVGDEVHYRNGHKGRVISVGHNICNRKCIRTYCENEEAYVYEDLNGECYPNMECSHDIVELIHKTKSDPIVAIPETTKEPKPKPKPKPKQTKKDKTTIQHWPYSLRAVMKNTTPGSTSNNNPQDSHTRNTPYHTFTIRPYRICKINNIPSEATHVIYKDKSPYAYVTMHQGSYCIRLVSAPPTQEFTKTGCRHLTHLLKYIALDYVPET